MTRTAGNLHSRRSKCVCDWPRPQRVAMRITVVRDGQMRSAAMDRTTLCNGLGVQHCEGCGGDLCVCVCGGQRACPGCDACKGRA
jgi:hypothetical protein